MELGERTLDERKIAVAACSVLALTNIIASAYNLLLSVRLCAMTRELGVGFHCDSFCAVPQTHESWTSVSNVRAFVPSRKLQNKTLTIEILAQSIFPAFPCPFSRRWRLFLQIRSSPSWPCLSLSLTKTDLPSGSKAKVHPLQIRRSKGLAVGSTQRRRWQRSQRRLLRPPRLEMQWIGYRALGLLVVPPCVIMVEVGLLLRGCGERQRWRWRQAHSPTRICCKRRAFACSLRGWTCSSPRAHRGAACWRGTCPSTSGELVALCGS